MSTYNDRISNLVRTYRYNPRLFNEQQVDELQQLADQFDIPFKRKTDEFNLRKTLMNLQTGFLEGFTTIPVGKLSGHEPTSTYEAIAHSLGHLAGFAPGIMAAPLKAVGAKTLSKVTSKANNWSIPMMFGDAAKAGMDAGLKKKLFGKANIESLEFMKKGAGPRAIIDQAVHLGAASAVSSVWKGRDEIMNSGIQGAIAGGAFGGLGEFRMIGNYLKSKNISDYRKGEQRLKAAVGASMMGVPTALQGEPIEMIIYQTLLGGYFGYGSRPAVEKEGGMFMQDLMYKNNRDYVFRPSLHPDINSYSKGAREYINKEATEYAKSYYRRNREMVSGNNKDEIDIEIENFVRQAKGLNPNEKPSISDINAEYRYRASEFYKTYYKQEGDRYYIHKDVRDVLNNHEHKMDATDDVSMPMYVNTKPKPNSKEERLLNTKKREKEKNIFATEESYDINGNKQTRIIGPFSAKELGIKGDYNGKRLGESRADRPADKLENTEYILWDTVFINEAKPGQKPKFEKYKPLDFTFGKDNTAEKRVSWKKVFETDLRLDEKGFYVFGGVKDKSTFTIRKYHTDFRRFSKEELFNALAKENNTSPNVIRDRYNESLLEFIKIYGHHKDVNLLTRMHEDAWRSNVLVEAQRNGLYDKPGDLSQIYKLERPGFAKNVIDWNKREQLYHDKSMPLKEGTLGTGNYEFAIFNDVLIQKYKNEKGEEKFYDSDTDGTIYFKPRDIEIMMDSLGMPSANVDMNKPVMIVKTPQGTMVVKAAGKGAPDGLVKYMDANNLKAVIMGSAAKHRGELQSNNFNVEALKRGEWNHIGDLYTGNFKDSDIRINLGTFVNPKKFGGMNKTVIARQLLGNLNNKDAKDVMSIVWDRIYEPLINGKEAFNKAVKDHLANKTDIKELESFIKKNKLDVDDLGLEVIHNIFVNHGNSKLAQKFAREIARQGKDGKLEDIDTFTPEEYTQFIYRNNRILDASNFSQSQRVAGRNSRQFWEQVYKKYFLKRLYAPDYKYATKAWLSPKDPVTTYTNDVKPGFFKLDYGQRNMSVIYKGKEMTLEKAWNKSGKNVNDPDLEMLVIRVPSDSMSGTRALKFAGFTRDKGYSITTNAKDNAYLGGADKDSDSVFIYQGMPRELHKATKKAAKQWERDDRMLDSKREKNDKLFGNDPLEVEKYKTVTSKYSPSLRRRVAETAAKGNQGLGPGLVAKENLISIADVVMKKGNYVNDIPVISKKDGKQYAKIDLELKPGGYERLIELGREITNRSADSSNYPTMIDFTKFPDMLVKEIFVTKNKVSLLNKKTGEPYKVQDLDYNMLSKSNLGDVINVRRAIDPGKADISFTQMQSILRNSNVKDFDSFGSFVGRKMQDMKITESFFEEAMFRKHTELVNNIGKFLEKRQNIPDSIIKEINQLTGYKSNTGNIIKLLNKGTNYENIRYMLERDLEAVSGYVSITEKGYDLYRIIDSLPISKKSKAMFVRKYLKPIAEEASRIKRTSYNSDPNRFTDVELKHSSSELFDRQVINYKNGNLAIHAGKIVNELKRLGVDIEYSKRNPNMSKLQEELNTYFDLWLLSPFYTQSVQTPFSKFPWQSKSIEQNSLEYYLNRQERIFNKLNDFQEGDRISKDIFKFEPEPSTPKQVIEKKVVEKFVPKDQAEYLKSRAVTDPELKMVEEFITRINKNEIIRDNLEDFYINWQLQNKGGIDTKDLSLIDIKDINAINNYLKDADTRFTSRGNKLPDFAFRASPEYMDLYMQNFENKFFAEMELPVRSRDGINKRKVKRFTSTMGELKDFMNKSNTQMETNMQNVSIYNKRRYPHLRLKEKDAESVNKLVFSLRESRDPETGIKPGDYKLTADYKRLSKKKFMVDGKEKTLDQLIEITDKKFTEDFKQFGDKYIYANKKDRDKYIKFNKDGSLNIKNIEKTIIEPMMERKQVTVPLDILREINYIMRGNFKVKFEPTGKQNPESYVPHLNFGRNKKTQKQIELFKKQHLEDFYNSKIAEGKTKKEAEELTKIEGFGIDTRVFHSQQDDKGLSSLNIFTSAKKRSAKNMPGWDNTHNAINLYKEGFIRGMYRNMFKIQSDIRLSQLEKAKPFGDRTKDWVLYLREYANNSLGFASTFNKDVLDNFVQADPKFKRRGYYLTSDQKIIDTYDAIEKRFKKLGRKVPFSKNIIPSPDPKLEKTSPALYAAQKEAHMQSLNRAIHKWGRMEAKYNLLTLLGHTKIMTGNLFGGGTMTISRGGLKNLTRVNRNNWLNKNLILDLNGNYRLKFQDGKSVKNVKDLNRYLEENGITESFIQTELEVNSTFAKSNNVVKQNLKDFAKDISKKLARDPEMSDKTLFEIAKKYGVEKQVESLAALPMQFSERKLRRDSFLTHAVEYMEHWGKYGLDLSLSDPAVMEAGFRGVEATQFIYHSSFRPSFMRTALGKVFSRFKLFVFNSARVRKEMLRKASYYDFEPGTKEFEKFKTDFAINMFVMALGTAYAYSLFDTTLPPPYDWIQETGEWLYGNKKERDRAFFGQWPYPVAPLNIVTPPVARIPMAAFSSLINKDWERFADYHMYTMFPFGRMIRSIDKTVDEPYGTIEGRALQQFFGLPLDKVRSRIDRAKVLEARENMINRELSEMENLL